MAEISDLADDMLEGGEAIARFTVRRVCFICASADTCRSSKSESGGAP
jgi:hypothetical protein